jgi:hypothetical protein
MRHPIPFHPEFSHQKISLPLVERLPDEVCGRDKAVNRRRHGNQSSALFPLDGGVAAQSGSVCRIRDNSRFEGRVRGP